LRLGPGFITGAADDDPSGIGTYSQVGAQFGFDLVWTAPISLPLASWTGLLAIPTLAGSAAYALSEAVDWEEGLGRKLAEAPRCYGVIVPRSS
jgi:hypothetical protein